MSKRLVYISHHSSGLKENTLDTEHCIESLYSCDTIFNNFCFVSPIHCYGFMYNSTEYYKGLQFCIDLLEHCESMVVIGNWSNSVGCTKEVEYCKNHGIKIFFIADKEKLDDMISNHLEEFISQL